MKKYTINTRWIRDKVHLKKLLLLKMAKEIALNKETAEYISIIATSPSPFPKYISAKKKYDIEMKAKADNVIIGSILAIFKSVFLFFNVLITRSSTKEYERYNRCSRL